MFTNKDFEKFFDELYGVETEMKKQMEYLLKYVKNPPARKIIERVRDDEIRHAEIVEQMRALI